jgi:hypothetical protein
MVVALACLVFVGGCTGDPPGQSHKAESTCRARGLLPGTAEFTACLHPNEAATVGRGEEAWQQMNNDVDE